MIIAKNTELLLKQDDFDVLVVEHFRQIISRAVLITWIYFYLDLVSGWRLSIWQIMVASELMTVCNAIITSFSARLYKGSRAKRKTEKIIAELESNDEPES